MCLFPEMFCYWCMVESSGQLLRYPVEEVEDGLRLCSRHWEAYLESQDALNFPAEDKKTAVGLVPSER